MSKEQSSLLQVYPLPFIHCLAHWKGVEYEWSTSDSLHGASLAVRPGGLIELGYPSLSGPHLSDSSYIMEMSSANLLKWQTPDLAYCYLRQRYLKSDGRCPVLLSGGFVTFCDLTADTGSQICRSAPRCADVTPCTVNIAVHQYLCASAATCCFNSLTTAIQVQSIREQAFSRGGCCSIPQISGRSSSFLLFHPLPFIGAQGPTYLGPTRRATPRQK
jgi:hypothetical protein